jgi:RluA family pseudouridine synthase
MMLVIDKPAGLPVHAGPKGGPNLEDHLDALRFGLPRRPGLAHRLDRDTSGCLVLGRHRQALARLGKLFAAGRVEKVYWAVVHGSPPESEGRIDAALRKRSETRGWWMEAHPEGQPSVTDYRVLGSTQTQDRGLTWLECHPRTGRTHQIRVHCAGLGCPVLGDPVYGPKGDDPRLPPLHLHARAITVPLYPSKPPITAQATPPEHMLAALRACGWRPDEAPALPASVTEG